MASSSSQRHRCSSTVNFNVNRFLESLPEHEAISPASSHSEAPPQPPPSPTLSLPERPQDNEPSAAFPEYDDSQFVPAVPASEEQPLVTYSPIIRTGRKRSSATAATLGPVVEEEEKPTPPQASFFEQAAKLREPMPDNEDFTSTQAKLNQEVAAPRDTAQDDRRASIQSDSRTAQDGSNSTQDGSNSTEGDVTSVQKNDGVSTQPTTAHSSIQLHLPQATGLPYAHTAPLVSYFGNAFPSEEEIQENKHGYIRLLNFLHYREQGLGNSWAKDPVKDPNFKAPIHLPNHQFNDSSDKPPVTEAERVAKGLDQIIRREVYDILWCNLDKHIKWPNSTFDRSNPGNAVLCKLAYSQRLLVGTVDEVLPADKYPETNYFLKLATVEIAHPEDFQRRFTGDFPTMNPYSHQQSQHYQADANWMHHPQQGVHHPGQQQNHPGHMNHPHAQQGHYQRIAASSGSGSHQHGGHSGGSDHNIGNAVPEPQTDEQRRIMQWVAELLNGNSREQALMELSKKREQVPELALIIWHSYGMFTCPSLSTQMLTTSGVMTVLCQEILQVYPMLNPSQLTAAASNRVCNALALLQCVASHQETRQLFLNGKLTFAQLSHH
jgi:Cell differentiation family, Rcd1-like